MNTADTAAEHPSKASAQPDYGTRDIELGLLHMQHLVLAVDLAIIGLAAHARSIIIGQEDFEAIKTISTMARTHTHDLLEAYDPKNYGPEYRKRTAISK